MRFILFFSYKKFTRGKDVNKYSTKDLANIFGKKDLSETIVVKEEKVEEEVEVVHDPIGSKDTTAGVLTFKGGNMNDYFKSKFYNVEKNGTSQIKEEPDDESETRMGFGYPTKSMSKFYVNDNGQAKEQESDGESQKYVGFGFTKSSEPKTKVKNHMDLNYVYDNPCLDLNIVDDSPVPKKLETKVIDLESSEKITPKKRKIDFSYANEGLDLNCSDRQTPKKRKNEYSFENKGLDFEYSGNQVSIKSECSEDMYEITEESLEVAEKRRSKKSKKNKNEPLPNGIENPALDLNAPDKSPPQKYTINSASVSPDSECSLKIDHPSDSRIKPRIIKCEIISNGFDNLGLDLNNSNKLTPKKTLELEAYENPALDLDVSAEPTPKKNRKIESRDSMNAFDNPGLDENFTTPDKSKNKNENISSGICNPGLDLNFAEEPTPKKCKKIKEPVAFSGLENPGLELEDRPTPKKPKRSKVNQALSTGLENPGLDLEYIDRPTTKKSKKNKNLSISHEFENPALEANSFTNDVCSSMDYEVSRTSTGLENNALDLSDESSSKRRVTFNDQLEYNTDVSKKKKKKKKNSLDKYEVVTDKLKKKHKNVEPESTTSFINEGLDLHMKNEEEIENEINERKSKKGKRRKERRMSFLETIAEAPEEDNSNQTPENEEVISDLACENMSMDAVDNQNEDVPTKKSKKKKKAKKDIVEDAVKVELHDESNGKKKKKKTVKEEPMEIVEVDNLEKENKSTKKDKTKKTDEKKSKKKSTEEDVVSLEEFLNDEEVLKTKQKNQNESMYSEICTVSEQIEVAVPKENHESSYQRFKKTKQVMKSLFMKNPTLMFTGSNINEIKGYGSQFYDN